MDVTAAQLAEVVVVVAFAVQAVGVVTVNALIAGGGTATRRQVERVLARSGEGLLGGGVVIPAGDVIVVDDVGTGDVDAGDVDAGGLGGDGVAAANLAAERAAVAGFVLERFAILRQLAVMLVGVAIAMAAGTGLAAVMAGPEPVPGLGMWAVIGVPVIVAVIGVVDVVWATRWSARVLAAVPPP